MRKRIYLTFIYRINPNTISIEIPRTNGPQKGNNTHHQDQLIIPTNFNTIKAIPNKPSVPPL